MWDYLKQSFKKALTLIILVLSSTMMWNCATKKNQLGKKATSLNLISETDSSEVVHQIYLTGNAYNIAQNQIFFEHLKNKITKTKSSSQLIFLGNTTRPNTQNSETNEIIKQEDLLLRNLDFWKDYKGSIIYTPGGNEWKSEGLKSLFSWQQCLLDNRPNQIQILPNKGCGLESMMLAENILLISLDSQWFLEDWDLHPNINQFCHHKTRESVLQEINYLLSENQEKTIVFSTHHPIFNNGYHGGQFGTNGHLYPLSNKRFIPIFGTFYSYLRKAGGWNSDDVHNYRYRNLFEEVKKIIKKHNNVIVVSGLEKNLQYIYQENIHQINSGSGNSFNPARAVNPYDFSYGNQGFVALSFHANKSVNATFYGIINQKEVVLFRKNIIKGKPIFNQNQTNQKIPDSITTSIYSRFKTRKSNAYHFLWGKHYKDLYQKEITLKTALLDTLYGGLKPIGIEQYSTSRFLTLKNKQGSEYWLMPIKKDVEDFLQTHSFQVKSENEPFQKTITQDFLEDYFTTIYPFAPLGIDYLSKSIGIHTLESELYYIPKSKNFESFQNKMGDEIYMIFKKPNSFQKNEHSFGNPEFIIDTDDLLYTLQTEKDHQIDVDAYLKVRLFDMLIGDWDRNASHYRWAAKKSGIKTIYSPIPFHRDQAFAKYDGAILSVLKQFSALGQMHHYGKKTKNSSSFNSEAYTLDLALLSHVSEKEWLDAAIFIQSHLSNQIIDDAFMKMSLNDDSKENRQLKEIFKNRLKSLRKTALKHHRYLEKKVIVVGTKLDDTFHISRLDKKRTQITVYQGKALPQNIVFEKTFTKKRNKDIWIYGLEGNDSIYAEGQYSNHSKLKIMGGQGNDFYNIDAGKKITVYDFHENTNQIKASKHTKIHLTNDYEINGYDFNKPDHDQINFSPLIGMNPDDGLRIGAKVEFLYKGFKSKPYSQKHTLSSNFYFATNGYDLAYQNIIKKIYSDWDFALDAGLTSSNFAMNFFGFGNDTKNLDRDFGFDYNRVKIGRMMVHPSFNKNLKNGQSFSLGAQFDRYEVEQTPGRFISLITTNTHLFEGQTWAGFQLKYVFENIDYPFWPTLGMNFFGHFSWSSNLEKIEKQVPTASSGIQLIYKIIPDATIILQTKLESKFILSRNYEFFQGATIGGDFSLRGFRMERFTGKQSYFQSSDLKFNLGTIKNPFVPIKYGCLIGLDYGRVWLPTETSNRWHTSWGGGLWFLNNQILKSHISYFNSSDGGRLTFGIDFNF
jgi:hypothetical protein